MNVINAKPEKLQREIKLALDKIQQLSPQLKKDKLCLETNEWLDKCRKVKTLQSNIEQDRLIFEGLALADLWEIFKNKAIVFRCSEKELTMTPLLKGMGIHSDQKRLTLYEKSEVIINALHEYSLRYSESIKGKSLTDKVLDLRQGHGLYTVLKHNERNPRLEIIVDGRMVHPHIPDDGFSPDLAAIIDPESYGYQEPEFYDPMKKDEPYDIWGDPEGVKELNRISRNRLHKLGIEEPNPLPTIRDLTNEGLVRKMFYSGEIDPKSPVLKSQYDPVEETIKLILPKIQLS